MLGRGAVPSTGVAAVVLRVALVSPDSRTWLRVWQAGALMPSAAVASANPGTSTGEVTVPVGPNGLVSLRYSVGMSHFPADVIGYYPTVEG